MNLERGFVIFMIVAFSGYAFFHSRNLKISEQFYQGGYDELCAQIIEVKEFPKCEEKAVRKTRFVKNVFGFPSSINYMDLETTCEVTLNGVDTVINVDDYPTELNIPNLSHRKVCAKFR